MRFPKIFAALAMTVTSTAFAQNISVATGGTGGVYYPMGGGLAAVLSKHVPGMQATAEVTGGSVDNLNLIASGKPYVGFSMVDAACSAYCPKTVTLCHVVTFLSSLPEVVATVKLPTAIPFFE